MGGNILALKQVCTKYCTSHQESACINEIPCDGGRGGGGAPTKIRP